MPRLVTWASPTQSLELPCPPAVHLRTTEYPGAGHSNGATQTSTKVHWQASKGGLKLVRKAQLREGHDLRSVGSVAGTGPAYQHHYGRSPHLVPRAVGSAARRLPRLDGLGPQVRYPATAGRTSGAHLRELGRKQHRRPQWQRDALRPLPELARALRLGRDAQEGAWRDLRISAARARGRQLPGGAPPRVRYQLVARPFGHLRPAGESGMAHVAGRLHGRVRVLCSNREL